MSRIVAATPEEIYQFILDSLDEDEIEEKVKEEFRTYDRWKSYQKSRVASMDHYEEILMTLLMRDIKKSKISILDKESGVDFPASGFWFSKEDGLVICCEK